MPPRSDVVLFLDLETTGAGDECEIIEIGAVLIDARTLEEISRFTSMVKLSPLGYLQISANAVVNSMHLKSGLLQDLEDVNTPDIATVDSDIVYWLRKVAGPGTSHIPLGGSGVSHFDRKFIKRFMPGLDHAITYWAYDVGVARRSFQLVGIPWLPQQKTHRALDDALYHVKEWRYYVGHLRDTWKVYKERYGE